MLPATSSGRPRGRAVGVRHGRRRRAPAGRPSTTCTSRCSASPSLHVHPPPEHLAQPVLEGVSQVKVMQFRSGRTRPADPRLRPLRARRRDVAGGPVRWRSAAFQADERARRHEAPRHRLLRLIEAEVEAENHEFEMMFRTDGRATAPRRRWLEDEATAQLTVALMQDVVRRLSAPRAVHAFACRALSMPTPARRALLPQHRPRRNHHTPTRAVSQECCTRQR